MIDQAVESESVIAVTLDARPRIHIIPKGVSTFEASGDHYEDVGLGSHNGFYDFLRSPAGAIIGVRLLPSPDAEQILTGIPEAGGFQFADDGQMRVALVFWGHERDFDPETSSDQYFGDNVVYRSKESGRLAVSFAIDLLSPSERATVLDSAGSGQ